MENRPTIITHEEVSSTEVVNTPPDVNGLPAKDAEFTTSLLSTKGKSIRLQILAIVCCLAYLAICFQTFNAGLQAVGNYVGVRLDQANTKWLATQYTHHRENLLYNRLEFVLDHPLQRGPFMESYEECLARGLHVAHDHFFGLDFTQYADIGNQTVAWVEESCSQLIYSPQIRYMTPQMASLAYWTNIGHQTRQLAEKAIHYLKSTVQMVRGWVMTPKTHDMPYVFPPTQHDKPTTPKPVVMPLGFELDCSGTPPCHLTRTTHSSTVSGSATVSEEALSQVQQEAARLRSVFSYVWRIYSFYTTLTAIIVALESVAFVAFGLTYCSPLPDFTLKRPWTDFLTQFPRFEDEFQYAIYSVLLQLGVSGKNLTQFLPLSSDNPFILPFGLIFCTLGLHMFTQFFIWGDQNENAFDLFRALRGLFEIVWKGNETSSLPLEDDDANDHNEPTNPQTEPETHAHPESGDTNIEQETGAPPVNADTNITNDFEPPPSNQEASQATIINTTLPKHTKLRKLMRQRQMPVSTEITLIPSDSENEPELDTDSDDDSGFRTWTKVGVRKC